MRSSRRAFLQQAAALAACGSAAGLLGACGHTGVGSALASKAAWPQPRLSLLGSEIIAHDREVAGTPLGGLSGLDYDAAQDVFYAVSDDRSDYAPARFYTFRARIGTDGLGALQWLGMTPLLAVDGKPYPALGAHSAASPDVPDFEGLRFDARTRSLLLTSEGDARRGMPPFLREHALNGHVLRTYALPQNLTQLNRNGFGPRNNLTLEGLAQAPDGSLWLGMEGSLLQDGTVGQAPGPCRLTQVARSGGVLQQKAYLPDAIGAEGVFGQNGISAMLCIDARYLLVLERSFNPFKGMTLKLYMADTATGSELGQIETLTADNHQAMQKRLLLDLADSSLRPLDNVEGMCWGPVLPDGRRTLALITDNNFSRLQVTQWSVFAWAA